MDSTEQLQKQGFLNFGMAIDAGKQGFSHIIVQVWIVLELHDILDLFMGQVVENFLEDLGIVESWLVLLI